MCSSPPSSDLTSPPGPTSPTTALGRCTSTASSLTTETRARSGKPLRGPPLPPLPQPPRPWGRGSSPRGRGTGTTPSRSPKEMNGCHQGELLDGSVGLSRPGVEVIVTKIGWRTHSFFTVGSTHQIHIFLGARQPCRTGIGRRCPRSRRPRLPDRSSV